MFFFFNDTATTEIYTLSLHDALPISGSGAPGSCRSEPPAIRAAPTTPTSSKRGARSEEHTSELQSRLHLVCRLLLEKKKTHNACISSYSIIICSHVHTTRYEC